MNAGRLVSAVSRLTAYGWVLLALALAYAITVTTASAAATNTVLGEVRGTQDQLSESVVDIRDVSGEWLGTAPLDARMVDGTTVASFDATDVPERARYVLAVMQYQRTLTQQTVAHSFAPVEITIPKGV